MSLSALLSGKHLCNNHLDFEEQQLTGQRHGTDQYLFYEDGQLGVLDLRGYRQSPLAIDLLQEDNPNTIIYYRLCGRRQYTDRYLSKLEPLGEFVCGFHNGGWKDEASDVPVGYTYLGQFLAHEISWIDVKTLGKDFPIGNRSAQIDLDSLIGAPPTAELPVGLTEPFPPIPSCPLDLFRDENGKAQILDPRNDDLLPLAQIHLAITRFYNAVSHNFGPTIGPIGVRRVVRQHFQSVVLHDYLRRLSDCRVYEDVIITRRARALPWPPSGPVMLPLEFALAAFRFGHSMVREGYPDWNPLAQGNVDQFWRFTGNSRDPRETPMKNLSGKWITNWSRLFDFSESLPDRTAFTPLLANQIDTRLTQQLGIMPPHTIRSDKTLGNLAMRTLLRCCAAEVADAQTIIQQFNQKLENEHVIHPLSCEELTRYEPSEVVEILCSDDYELVHATPLWYYILKEAKVRGGGCRLGPLGSRLVVETLYTILWMSPDSILQDRGWRASLPYLTPQGEYSMASLLCYAGEVDPVKC